MKVRIVFDCDGTDEMQLEADRVSSQVCPGGRALIRLRTADGRVLRAVQFARVHVVDIDMEARS